MNNELKDRLKSKVGRRSAKCLQAGQELMKSTCHLCGKIFLGRTTVAAMQEKMHLRFSHQIHEPVKTNKLNSCEIIGLGKIDDNDFRDLEKVLFSEVI